jgi:pimeloyl-ACP methyl ester carboxylesterase
MADAPPRSVAQKVGSALADFAMIAAASPLGLLHLVGEWLGVEALPAAAHTPLVVLIHGTGAAGWQWAVACSYLKARRVPFYCVDYDSERPIAESADDVFAQVRAVVEARRPGRLALVGHSQGGLIARLIHNRWRKEAVLDTQLVSTFLLHAPQHGTRAANLWNTTLRAVGLGSRVKRSMRNMEHASRFAQTYQRYCDDDGGRVFEVAGTGDFVEPSEAFWKCASDRRYLSNRCHYAAAVDPQLWTEFIIPRIMQRPSQITSNALLLDDAET